MRSCDELFFNPLFLELGIDGQVREVGAVVEIGDSPRDSDEQAFGISCGEHHIGMAQHAFDPLGICDGTTFCQGRSNQAIDELLSSQIRFVFVVNHLVFLGKKA